MSRQVMRKMATAAGVMAGLLFMAAGASGAPLIQGTASIIDGDTIEIHGERIRLDAIDAPESSQTPK
jgi:endonuclease YncB( thermonuclease family)